MFLIVLLKKFWQVGNFDNSKMHIMITVTVDEAAPILVELNPHCVIGPDT
jgi:hypothetical protein